MSVDLRKLAREKPCMVRLAGVCLEFPLERAA